VAEIQSINYPLHPSRIAQRPATFHSGLDRRQFSARRTFSPAAECAIVEAWRVFYNKAEGAQGNRFCPATNKIARY